MQILIDNATVTAALRAAGQIPNRNRELFDLDVTALRVFVEALVFGNEVIVVDNYKEEYSEERKSILQKHGVKFVQFPTAVENKLRRDAVAHT